MGLTLHQRPSGPVSDSPLDDAQLVREPLPDDVELVHESKERNPSLDNAQLVHEPKEQNFPLDDAQVVDGPRERDPHVVPKFTSESLSQPSSTVLYLPPLLSSLPQDLCVPPVSVLGRPPLVTETRLPEIDPVSLSLHKALHHFRPLSDDYADLPYALAFNWSTLELPEDEEREWYAVVFRSRRKKDSDSCRE